MSRLTSDMSSSPLPSIEQPPHAAASLLDGNVMPLPCPFCGEKSVEVREGSTFRWRVVECLSCGARCGEVRAKTIGPADSEGDERRAVHEWNQRHNVPVKRDGTACRDGSA